MIAEVRNKKFMYVWPGIVSSFFISYKNSRIHCLQWGTGEKLLLCFHGFGEEAGSFMSLALRLQHQYTIIAMDLPLHGQTNWNEGLRCTTADIVHMIDKVPALHNRSFSLAGFSMGGRVALAVYEQIPRRVQQLVLLAPDGLKTNFWYWLATQTAIGNRLFRHLMKNPEPFFAVTGMLKNMHMINMGVYHYVTQYLKQEDMRSRLYNIWTTMRKIRPRSAIIQSLISGHKTPVVFIYGRYDRVIRYTTGLAFKKRAGDCCTLHILPCGHRVLQEKNTAAIAALL